MSCLSSLFGRFDKDKRQSLSLWRRVAPYHEDRRGSSKSNGLSATISSHDYCDNTVITSRYTVLTFIPMNFWEQVQRPMNAYFVVVTALLCIPAFAPISPLTIIIPLALAFLLSGMKEAVDDYRRHEGDKRQNSRLHRVYNPVSKGFEAVRSRHLRVGDVVLLLDGDEVPCDVVPLHSANAADGSTFVTTANLDGEADAKVKYCVLSSIVQRRHPEAMPRSEDEPGDDADGDEDESRLSHIDRVRKQVSRLRELTEEGPIDLGAAPDILNAMTYVDEVLECSVFDCEPPTRKLTAFHGTCIVFDTPLRKIRPAEDHGIHSQSMAASRAPHVLHRLALNLNELLVCTSVMSSTPWTLATVVYTGNESKIYRSRKPAPVKWSSVDRLTNRFAVGVIAFVMLTIVGLTALSFVQQSQLEGHAWYLRLGSISWSTMWIATPIRFFLLLSIMVPLSVKVTLELSKFYISELIEWDADLYDEDTDTAATVNARALTEELGLVQFVMADKTGTLTENTMSLRKIAICSSRSGAGNRTDDRDAETSVKTLGVPKRIPLLFGRGPGDNVSFDGEHDDELTFGLRREPSFEADPRLPMLNGDRARETLTAEAGALQLAYAIAINNSCDVSLELIHTGRVSRQNSKSRIADPDHPVSLDDSAATSSAPFSPASAKLSATVTHQRSYASASPDEVALVETISEVLKVTLLRRTKKQLLVRRPALDVPEAHLAVPQVGTSGKKNHTDVLEVVGIVPFSSDRGLMTVFVQASDSKRGIIYVKGSDERVLPLCVAGPVRGVQRAVDDFAREGLRTLVFATREMPADQVEAWKAQMTSAAAITDVDQRNATIKALQSELERDLTVIGATGVEDELQRQVPQAISSLRRANVRVWMLTGDKHMTAVQTAKLSGLVTDNDEVITFNVDPNLPEAVQREQLSDAMRIALDTVEKLYHNSSEAVPSTLKLARMEEYRSTMDPEFGTAPLLDVPAVRSDMRPPSSPVNPGRTPSRVHPRQAPLPGRSTGQFASPPTPYTVVVTGRSLEAILRVPELEEELSALLAHATTVVCCRVTPDQKAAIVAMMRRRGAMCLAIGDGGNDVAMIQEADVGIGITGKEGRQAAQAADFNIAKFRYLLPLLYCHGHTAVMRSSYTVQYIFYKSIILGIAQAAYNALFSLASGVSYYDSFALTMYNSAFTGLLSMLPVLDTHLPRSVLVSIPRLYQLSQTGSYMTITSFNTFVLRAVVHGLFIFFVASYIWDGDFVGTNGQPFACSATYYVLGYAALILIQCMIVTVEFHSVTMIHAVIISLSFLSFFICYGFYSAVFTEADFYGSFDAVIGASSFSLGVIVVTGAVMVPFAFIGALRFHIFPTLLQLKRRELYMGRAWDMCKPTADNSYEQL